ncbi:MAG: RNA methyltransferase [Paludibacteraceae bacterium]|nr:RNA methyltransferase [Paludibacteraceae bacterium]
MLSKNQLKDLSQYALKKRRDEDHVFVAEGRKLIEELASSFSCRTLVGTDPADSSPFIPCKQYFIASRSEMERISLQKSARDSFAVFLRHDASDNNHLPSPYKGLTLALDTVQDPGNLGTIIRICDWFGVEQVWCSEGCADPWSPKVVQSTMGALARVHVSTNINLTELLSKARQEGIRIYGTQLDGENIYQKTLDKQAIVVMGNEGNGLSNEVRKLVNEHLLIPSFPPDRITSESLNVAVATAVVIGEFRRRN